MKKKKCLHVNYTCPYKLSIKMSESLIKIIILISVLNYSTNTQHVYLTDTTELTYKNQLRCINYVVSDRSLSGSTVKVDLITIAD